MLLFITKLSMPNVSSYLIFVHFLKNLNIKKKQILWIKHVPFRSIFGKLYIDQYFLQNGT